MAVLVDGTDFEAWRAALQQKTDVVFFETVSNPTLEVIDIAAVAELAHAAGACVMVDNVFATPVWSDALSQGADVVIYSATKHIDGQGRALGGVVLGTRAFIRETIEPYMKHTGGSMSPFTAWMMLKGLETLELRVRAQTQSALAIAAAIEGHPALRRVLYPGLPSHPNHAVAKRQMGAGGTVLSLDFAGGQEAAFRFLNAIKIGVLSNNLGDAKTILTHPATTTHQRLTAEQRTRLGITEGLVRVSIGLEATEDLLDDMRAALEAV